jgi:hypothetical protein
VLTRATSRLTTAAIATAAGLAVLAPTAHAVNAVDASAAAKPPARLTVASYTAYLKAQKTPEAKKTLKKFSALSNLQKYYFVQYLQNRAIYKALVQQTKGNVGRSVHVVKPFNKDVRFVTDVVSQAGKDKNRTTRVTFTVTEEIYRIPVTSETLSLRYQAVKPTTKASARAAVTNVNAAIAIKPGKVAVQGGKAGAAAHTSWTALPQVKSFGKKLVKDQNLASTRGTWKAQLLNR